MPAKKTATKRELPPAFKENAERVKRGEKPLSTHKRPQPRPPASQATKKKGR